ncbi:MAG: hypothetical protein R2729_30610 [Bryobacteraceae bacterium]
MPTVGLKPPRAADSQPRGLVEAVAASATFARSPVLRKLLLYLWDHRGVDGDSTPGEYAIAVDVFGKGEDFDPRIDATVRVQVSRLRHKLKEYDEKEGAGAAERLTIPAGSHRLEIEAVPRPTMVRPAFPWRGLLAAAAIAAIVSLAAWNFALRADLAARQTSEALPEFWRAMLHPGRLTRIIYPIPVFYNFDRLRVRDVDNNDPDGWRNSPRLAPFVRLHGAPALSQSYSVSSDTAAVIQLTRFLALRQAPSDVSAAEEISLGQYGNENLILLGILPTNAALEPFLRGMNFHTASGGGAVANRAPAAGEPERWVGRTISEGQQIRYGLIAAVPGQTAGSRLLLLMGLDTASLGAALTSPPSLADLTGRWSAAGRPALFEAVIEARVHHRVTQRARVIALRPIAPTR